MSGRRIAVMRAAEPGAARGYDLKVGPMWFVSVIGPLSESIGDQLEASGAVVVPGERAPRPVKLTIPVRAGRRETDPRTAGMRMRREVRALFNNAVWRLSGLYVWFAADADMEGWYLVGGGDLTEVNGGVTFGDFTFELTDAYLAGRPGTHRPGRRLEMSDRRGGLVARDTRGTIYSTDFADQDLPAEPLVIPGDVVNAAGVGYRTPASSSAGPEVAGRRLWRSVAALPGETVSYLPDDAILVENAYRDLDDPGMVRVWTLADAGTYPPDPNPSPERSADPTLDGWRAVYGELAAPTTKVAIDNGACRVVWIGSTAGTGLALERLDASTGAYVREARVLAAGTVRETRIIEVTSERAVVEWRGGPRALRVVLQRGWHGPRLEAYEDDGSTASLEFGAWAGTISVGDDQTPSWVDELSVTPSDGRDAVGLLIAPCTSDVISTDTTDFVDAGVAYQRARAVVAQVDIGEGDDAAALAALSLVDAQSIPTLIGI